MTLGAVVVYGGGGHGKVVADLALCCGLTVLGFVDDGREPGTVILGTEDGPQGALRVLGSGGWVTQHTFGFSLALAIGNNSARARIALLAEKHGLELQTLVHPKAQISRFASLGLGTVVMAGAVVNPSAQVGRGCIVNTGAVVEHDVKIGDYAHVSPNATLCGAAGLGEGSHLGAGATVLPQVQVGAHSVVGAGAVVCRDVPDHCVVAGVPARALLRG